MTEAQPPLSGIRVLDVATLFAGPLIATFLGDFGADVVKVEHPRGDPVRVHGPTKDGVPLWWKVVGHLRRRRRHAGPAVPGARQHRERPR